MDLLLIKLFLYILGFLFIILVIICWLKKKKTEWFPFTLSIIAFVVGFNMDLKAPEIYRVPNEHDNEITVEIKAPTALYDIFYTTDGSDPKSGSIYSEPFLISKTTIITAKTKWLIWWSEPTISIYDLVPDDNPTQPPSETVDAPPTNGEPSSSSIPVPENEPPPSETVDAPPTNGEPSSSSIPVPENEPPPSTGIDSDSSYDGEVIRYFNTEVNSDGKGIENVKVYLHKGKDSHGNWVYLVTLDYIPHPDSVYVYKHEGRLYGQELESSKQSFKNKPTYKLGDSAVKTEVDEVHQGFDSTGRGFSSLESLSDMTGWGTFHVYEFDKDYICIGKTLVCFYW